MCYDFMFLPVLSFGSGIPKTCIHIEDLQPCPNHVGQIDYGTDGLIPQLSLLRVIALKTRSCCF